MTTAILFPGQGSQSIGMLADISDIYPQIKDTFNEASNALGYDLWQVAQAGPEERLNSTEVTQPAILTASIALWRLLQSINPVQVQFFAGHSLGEYSALVAADVIDLATGVKLVERRGQLMQEAVKGRETAMAAVLGLDDQTVVKVCQVAAGGECVEAVNFNCPGQVVIAGDAAAVDRAIEGLKDAGAKRAIKLAVSVPSHCALMKPAADLLADTLETVSLKSPTTPIVQNVNAAVSADMAELKGNLIKQLYSSVLWTQSVQGMVAQGVDRFYECGPGKVLAGLVKKVDRSLDVVCLSDVAAWQSSAE
ncbi:[acyl-carrier-protein] S-malonyltransferase [Hahella sp. CCB-MM4]|uniref:ACP S-malonyltransferase n=1 Tax=Hahella sp. (strain CCB-MM4) TaxID=1926491 RepID=UPI000B9A7540|nr:ACP S-malonyltransferase [Hahella sp. CCB-MM4]OZG71300.1 [acyl-carrier-protein] S-malonyltransferase [Hahella sp. CCB-MM4]